MTYEPNSDTCDRCGGRDADQLTPESAAKLRPPDHQTELIIGRSRPTSGELSVGHIHRLETGRGGGVNLCRQCWLAEMTWRMERNRKVATPFDVIPFPEAKP
jgi:hypothetical protein